MFSGYTIFSALIIKKLYFHAAQLIRCQIISCGIRGGILSMEPCTWNFQSLYSQITLWGSTWAANLNQKGIGTVLYNMPYIEWVLSVYRILHVLLISCSPNLYRVACWKTFPRPWCHISFSYKMISYNQTAWMKDPGTIWPSSLCKYKKLSISELVNMCFLSRLMPIDPWKILHRLVLSD